MNLHDWIDELCDALDVEIDLDESLVLDVAREAAHGVARPAAPLTTFLLGYALGASAGGVDELDRLGEVTTDLARRWGKTPDDLAHEDDDPEVEQELTDA